MTILQPNKNRALPLIRMLSMKNDQYDLRPHNLSTSVSLRLWKNVRYLFTQIVRNKFRKYLKHHHLNAQMAYFNIHIKIVMNS